MIWRGSHSKYILPFRNIGIWIICDKLFRETLDEAPEKLDTGEGAARLDSGTDLAAGEMADRKDSAGFEEYVPKYLTHDDTKMYIQWND